MVNVMPSPFAEEYLKIFNEQWQNSDKFKDVTAQVLEYIETVYNENAPEFIYFITLYNIFNEFLDGLMSIKWTSKITQTGDFRLDLEINRGCENGDGQDYRNRRYRKAGFVLAALRFEKNAWHFGKFCVKRNPNR